MGFLFLSFFLFLLKAKDTWAVQLHLPPEGLYVHIMSHILFTSALIFLLYFLKNYPLGLGKTWKYLRISFFLFFLWNLDTLVAHILAQRLPPDALSKPLNFWDHRLLPPFSWEKILYYISHFDHILCIPAMFFLVMSLRAFLYEEEEEEKY